MAAFFSSISVKNHNETIINEEFFPKMHQNSLTLSRRIQKSSFFTYIITQIQYGRQNISNRPILEQFAMKI